MSPKTDAWINLATNITILEMILTLEVRSFWYQFLMGIFSFAIVRTRFKQYCKQKRQLIALRDRQSKIKGKKEFTVSLCALPGHTIDCRPYYLFISTVIAL